MRDGRSPAPPRGRRDVARRLWRHGRRGTRFVDRTGSTTTAPAGTRRRVDRAVAWTSAIAETALLTDVRAAHRPGYDRTRLRVRQRHSRLRGALRRSRRCVPTAPARRSPSGAAPSFWSGWSRRSTPISRRSRRRGRTPVRRASHPRRRRSSSSSAPEASRPCSPGRSVSTRRGPSASSGCRIRPAS